MGANTELKIFRVSKNGREVTVKHGSTTSCLCLLVVEMLKVIEIYPIYINRKSTKNVGLFGAFHVIKIAYIFYICVPRSKVIKIS